MMTSPEIFRKGKNIKKSIKESIKEKENITVNCKKFKYNRKG